MSLGIFRDQVSRGLFRSGNTYEATTARPITVEDQGKVFFITDHYGGVLNLPAWADVPDDFSFGVVRSIVLAGKNDDYIPDASSFIALFPGDTSDFFLVQVSHSYSQMSVPGQGIYNTDQDLNSFVFKDASTPGRWVVSEWGGSWSGFRSDQAKIAAVDPGSPGYWYVYAQYPTYFLVSLKACTPTGEADPLDRVFYQINTYTYESSFPYSDSGGTPLPFFVEIENISAGSYSFITYGLQLGFYGAPIAPPFALGDTNFMRNDGGFIGGRFLGGEHNQSLNPGEVISFYIGNGSPPPTPGQPYSYYPRRGLFLRMLPGETTPRSWEQSLALGPW